MTEATTVQIERCLGRLTTGDPAARAELLRLAEDRLHDLTSRLLGGFPRVRRHFDDTTGAAYLARAYVDSLRLGISNTIWYLWTAAYYDLLGVQMGGFTPAVDTSFSILQLWLEGSTFRGCTTTGGVTECSFVGNGAPFILAFADAPGTPYANGAGTAHFIDGSSAPGSSVTTLGFAPVRFD